MDRHYQGKYYKYFYLIQGNWSGIHYASFDVIAVMDGKITVF
jgi:hypothetical protein